MNYRQILITALKTTWKNKYLWVFGFLAGITLGISNYNLYSYNFIQGGSWLFQNLRHIINSTPRFAVILLLVSIIVWAIGTLARISLIAATGQYLESDSSRIQLNELFQKTLTKFLPIIIMQLVVWSPIIIVSLLFVFVARLEFSSSTVFQNFPNTMTKITEALIIPILIFPGIVLHILPIILIFVDSFAYRSMVLSNNGLINSIKHTLLLLKTFAKEVLILTSVCLVLGLIYTTIMDLLLTPLLDNLMINLKAIAPHCVRSNGHYFDLMNCLINTPSNLAVIPIMLVVGLILAILTSIWITFQSVTFTIAYNHFIQQGEST